MRQRVEREYILKKCDVQVNTGDRGCEEGVLSGQLELGGSGLRSGSMMKCVKMRYGGSPEDKLNDWDCERRGLGGRS